jgi:hypothetical protein
MKPQHKVCGIPAILIECKNIAFVLNAGHTVDVLMFGGKDLIFHVIWSAAVVRVFWAIIPQQGYHHFSYKTQQL